MQFTSLVRRRAAVAMSCALLLALVPAAADAGATSKPSETAPDGDASTQLADRYAPFVALQSQAEQCGPGEAFQPEDVQVILDQPDVVLRDASGAVITTAPGAADLFQAPEGSNFDLPGDSQRPGCDFDRRFGRRSTGTRPVTYARIVVEDAGDSGRAPRLVVQYWLYFVYNDWNNVHESDWEMAQIVFDAATPAAALAAGPALMTLSQHFGNERRAWDDIEKVGDRPVIYPAEGSHAIFYSQELWFGMSGDAGFGCDDTRAPSTRLDPSVTMLPDPQTLTADSEFAWLAFKGFWGQRQHVSTNDSELGPQSTPQWIDPFAYTDGGRDSAVTVPQIDLGVTRFFCTASKNVSQALNHLLANPPLLVAIVVGIVALVVLLVRRTRWRPAVAEPLRMRRRGGQVLSSAWAIVLTNKRRYLPVALLVFIGGLVGAILQPWILRHTFLGGFVSSVDRGAVSGTVTALAAGAMETVPVLIAAVIIGLRITHRVDLPAAHEIRTALTSKAVVPVLVLFAAMVFVGPFALLLVPAFAAAPAAALAEDLRPVAALRRSWALGSERKLRTLVVTFAMLGASLLLAPLFGVVLLLVIGNAFFMVNVVAGAVNAFTIPWLAAALYLQYADLAVADAASEVEASEMNG
ncbi:MAG: hypothetical protein RJA49_567 [Actinomycetota bacterium]